MNAKKLRGWKIHDQARDHVYKFRNNIELLQGEYVRIHSGDGTETATTGCNGSCFTYYDIHWRLDDYVWNNNGDVATLRNPKGKVKDRCRYGPSTTSPKRCASS